MLGASPARAFRQVTLPLLVPSILAAASIVFLFTFTSFGVALLLADPAHATLEVEIYRQAVELLRPPDRGGARGRADRRRAGRAAGAGPGPGAARGHAAAGVARPRPRAGPRGRGAFGRRRGLGRHDRCSSETPLAGSRVAVGARRRAVELRRRTAPSARARRRARCSSRRGPRCATRSCSRAIATVDRARGRRTGGAGASRRGPGARPAAIDTLLMLPLGTSAVTIGFGFLLAFDRSPLDLSTSTLIVPIAQAVVAIPFVVRIRRARAAQHRPALRDAAAMLGASPAQVWREVDFPIVAARLRRRGRILRRGVARRVRRHARSSPGPTRRPCRSRSSGSSVAPGRAERGPVAGDGDDPDGADRRRRVRDRTGPRCAASGEF